MWKIVYTCDHCGCEFDDNCREELIEYGDYTIGYNLCAHCFSVLDGYITQFVTKAMREREAADNG